MFKVNNKNTRARSKICSKLTIKTPERRQWCRSGVFIVNFGQILHLLLVFLLLTLNRYMSAGSELLILLESVNSSHDQYLEKPFFQSIFRFCFSYALKISYLTALLYEI